MHTKEDIENVKLEFERIDHDDGEISYEHNDFKRLIVIREFNFEKPIEAKFYAERIEATWNALTGVKTEDLPGSILALVKAAEAACNAYIGCDENREIVVPEVTYRLLQTLKPFEGIKEGG